MAKQYTCDYCGEPIVDEHLMVSVDARGNTYDPDGIWGSGDHTYSWVREPVGNYHATEDQPCWAEMLDRIQLIHAVSSELGSGREAIERRIEQRTERQRQRDNFAESERDHRERERAWRRFSQDRRDELLLLALGGEKLTVREWTERLNAVLDSPSPADGWPTVYPSTVIKMAKRMLRDGQLDREPEMFNKTHVRYRYFGKRGLDGPNADLEQQFDALAD